MSFIPYMNTGYGPQMVIPIPMRKIEGNVNNSAELEKKLKDYIDSRIKEMGEMIAKLPVDINKINDLKKQIKDEIKAEINAYLCSDCVKTGEYNKDKTYFNDFIKDQFKRQMGSLENDMTVNFNMQIKTLGKRIDMLQNEVSQLTQYIESSGLKQFEAELNNIKSHIKTTGSSMPSSDIISKIGEMEKRFLDQIADINTKLDREIQNKLVAYKDIDVPSIIAECKRYTDKIKDELTKTPSDMKDKTEILTRIKTLEGKIDQHITGEHGDITAELEKLAGLMGDISREHMNYNTQLRNINSRLDESDRRYQEFKQRLDECCNGLKEYVDVKELAEIKNTLRTITDEHMNINRRMVALDRLQIEIQGIKDRLMTEQDKTEILRLVETIDERINFQINSNVEYMRDEIQRLTQEHTNMGDNIAYIFEIITQLNDDHVHITEKLQSLNELEQQYNILINDIGNKYQSLIRLLALILKEGGERINNVQRDVKELMKLLINSNVMKPDDIVKIQNQIAKINKAVATSMNISAHDGSFQYTFDDILRFLNNQPPNVPFNVPFKPFNVPSQIKREPLALPAPQEYPAPFKQPVLPAPFTQPTIPFKQPVLPAPFTQPTIPFKQPVLPAPFTQPTIQFKQPALPAPFTQPTIQFKQPALPAPFTQPTMPFKQPANKQNELLGDISLQMERRDILETARGNIEKYLNQQCAKNNIADCNLPKNSVIVNDLAGRQLGECPADLTCMKKNNKCVADMRNVVYRDGQYKLERHDNVERTDKLCRKPSELILHEPSMVQRVKTPSINMPAQPQIDTFKDDQRNKELSTYKRRHTNYINRQADNVNTLQTKIMEDKKEHDSLLRSKEIDLILAKTNEFKDQIHHAMNVLIELNENVIKKYNKYKETIHEQHSATDELLQLIQTLQQELNTIFNDNTVANHIAQLRENARLKVIEAEQRRRMEEEEERRRMAEEERRRMAKEEERRRMAEEERRRMAEEERRRVAEEEQRRRIAEEEERRRVAEEERRRRMAEERKRQERAIKDAEKARLQEMLTKLEKQKHDINHMSQIDRMRIADGIKHDLENKLAQIRSEFDRAYYLFENNKRNKEYRDNKCKLEKRLENIEKKLTDAGLNKEVDKKIEADIAQLDVEIDNINEKIREQGGGGEYDILTSEYITLNNILSATSEDN